MTQKFGLIGYPLTHSFSRRFFTEKFQQESIDAEYLNFEIPEINRFPDIISNTENLKGLNVTIPYKEQIIPFLNEIDDAAKAIGAVNTIRIGHHAKGVVLRGFNTDVIGFRESIRPLLQPHHRRALVLGTGGASKAGRAGAGADSAFGSGAGSAAATGGGAPNMSSVLGSRSSTSGASSSHGGPSRL